MVDRKIYELATLTLFVGRQIRNGIRYKTERILLSYVQLPFCTYCLVNRESLMLMSVMSVRVGSNYFLLAKRVFPGDT